MLVAMLYSIILQVAMRKSFLIGKTKAIGLLFWDPIQNIQLICGPYYKNYSHGYPFEFFSPFFMCTNAIFNLF